MFDKKDVATLREMVYTDFKLRYQDSVLGYLWSLMRPLLLFGVLYMVFVFVLKADTIDNYPTYLLLGVVLWTYFTEITQRSVTVIVERGDLLRKISISRHLLVLSVTIAATINLAISFIPVVFSALISGADVSSLFFLFPLVILELFVFGLGLSFLLSALYVKIRDIAYLWEVMLQSGFYATPILYALQFVPDKYHWVFFLNPVAQILQDARYLLVTQDSITVWGLDNPYVPLAPIGIVLLVLVVGIRYFAKHQRYFAEEI